MRDIKNNELPSHIIDIVGKLPRRECSISHTYMQYAIPINIQKTVNFSPHNIGFKLEYPAHVCPRFTYMPEPCDPR